MARERPNPEPVECSRCKGVGRDEKGVVGLREGEKKGVKERE